MKTKIETIANVIVILFAVVVGAFFLKDRLSAAVPEPSTVKAGDKLANLKGWDWGAHDQTLVLGLRKGCHFCTACRKKAADSFDRQRSRARLMAANFLLGNALANHVLSARDAIVLHTQRSRTSECGTMSVLRTPAPRFARG